MVYLNLPHVILTLDCIKRELRVSKINTDGMYLL